MATFDWGAKAKREAYEEAAARYDEQVVRHRTIASRVELFIAVGLAVLGAAGSAGLVAQVSTVAAVYAEQGLALAALQAGHALLALAVAVAAAYVGAARPRDKMAAYAAASEACGAVASVAAAVEAARFPEQADPTPLLENLVASMLAVLESTAKDNQPPLDRPKEE